VGEVPPENTDDERTDEGLAICELAIEASSTQSDSDVLLDQLITILSVTGIEDTLASLPQNCLAAKNGQALEGGGEDDSEARNVLLALSGGDTTLNVAQVSSLRAGGQRGEVTQRGGRMLLQQQDEGSSRKRPKMMSGPIGRRAGLLHHFNKQIETIICSVCAPDPLSGSSESLC
jgi:hypothetical protein